MSTTKLAEAAKALLTACDTSVYTNDYCGLEVSKHDATQVTAAIEALREALEAKPAQVRLTDEQIEDIAEAEVKAGRMNWAGFQHDSRGVYMRPVVSRAVCDLVRAAIAKASKGEQA